MKKRMLYCLAAILVPILLAGCQNASTHETDTRTSAPMVIKQDPGTIDDVHLRDNPLLYTMDDPTKVTTLYLTVSSGNKADGTDHTWEEINTYSVYDYGRMGVDRYQVEGLLQVGDENGPLAGQLGYGQSLPNCTVQIRGQTSSNYSQKNYKIAIKDNKGNWNGQTTIALNKHMGEGLRFRNKLAYDLMSGIDPLMGLRTRFVHLYVRDTTAGSDTFEDYGLYTQVEQLNKTALKAHGLNKNGHLYKINFFEFYRYEDIIKRTDEDGYDPEAFEALLEIKGNTDHTKLIQMLDAVNDYSVPIDSVLDQYFDVENLCYWMGFHILMGNKDTDSRNAYIYSPLNSNKWYFYSWDNDSSLMKEEYAMTNHIDGLGWNVGVSNYWGNVLFHRALMSQSFRDALDAAIMDLYAYLSPQRVGTLANTYKDVVKPYVYAMPDVENAPLTPEQYDTIVEGIADEVRQNYLDYRQSYLRPQPFYIAIPVKTEDGICYTWDTSFDFRAQNITYDFVLEKDYDGNEILMEESNLVIPQVEGKLLPPGQYFIKVVATNESGESQFAFDYYEGRYGKVYGTKCFYVLEDGSILEDVYEEG